MNTNTNSQADELDTIYPEQTTVKTRAGEVKVSPAQVRQLSAATKIVRPISAEFSKEFPSAEGLSVAAVGRWLVMSHIDEAAALVDVLAPMKVRAEDLDAADFLRVLIAVVRVNVDFFSRDVLPMLLDLTEKAGLAQAQAQAPQAGAKSSPDSSRQDTAAPTSTE